MTTLFRFLMLAILFCSSASLIGCGPSKITSDEIPTDIGDEGEEESEDANAPEEDE